MRTLRFNNILVQGLLIAASSSAMASSTFTVAEFKSGVASVLGWFSRPKFCVLHLKALSEKEVPSFVGQGPLFRAQLSCDAKNVASTDLVRDPDFVTVEQVYTELLPELSKRNLKLILNRPENGGMSYLFEQK